MIEGTIMFVTNKNGNDETTTATTQTFTDKIHIINEKETTQMFTDKVHTLNVTKVDEGDDSILVFINNENTGGGGDHDDNGEDTEIFTDKIHVTPCHWNMSDPVDNVTSIVRESSDCDEEIILEIPIDPPPTTEAPDDEVETPVDEITPTKAPIVPPTPDSTVAVVTSYVCPIEEEVPTNTDEEATPTTEPPREIVVPFDFEMVYDETANLEDTLGSLENVYLQDLAGSLSCSSSVTTASARKFDGYSTRLLQQEQQEDAKTDETNVLIGITGEPSDEPDPINESCIVPVLSSLTVGSECVPINGGITMLVSPDATAAQEDNVKKGVLESLRQGMAEGKFLSGDIRKVSFIGTRLENDNNTPSPTPVFDGVGGIRGTTTDNNKNGDVSPLSVGLFIGAGVLFLLSLLVFFVIRKQRRNASMVQDAIFVDATLGNNGELSADPIIEADPIHHDGWPAATTPVKRSRLSSSLDKDENKNNNNNNNTAATTTTEVITTSSAEEEKGDNKNSFGGNLAEMDEYESFEDPFFNPKNPTTSPQPITTTTTATNDQQQVIDQLHSISEETIGDSFSEDHHSEDSSTAVREIV